MGVQFEYEGMSIPYNGNIYFPDFTVQGDLVIEVKGPFVMNPEKVESKAKAGVDREETYVVIGNEDLPCDHHIEYTDNVEDMEDKLDDLIY